MLLEEGGVWHEDESQRGLEGLSEQQQAEATCPVLKKTEHLCKDKSSESILLWILTLSPWRVMGFFQIIL